MSAMTLVEGVGSPVNVTLVLGCHLPSLYAKLGPKKAPRAFLADSKLRMKSSTNPTEKESSFSEECVFHLEMRSQDLSLLLK